MGMTTTAMVIGVPVTWQEFEARAPKSDWLSKYVDRDADTKSAFALLREGWESDYKPGIADLYKELISHCEQVGVRVYRGAGLREIKEATETAGIVVLVSHWKGPEVTFADLLVRAGAEAFLERVSGKRTPLKDWLAAELKRAGGSNKACPRPWWRSLNRRPSGKSVHDVLNECLDADICDIGPQPEGVDRFVEANITRRTRRRDAMDSIFERLLRPGNRLEMFDGMHDVSTVDAHVSPTFSGILDLSVCTSVPLASRISASRGHLPRIVQFEFPEHPTVAALSIGAAITLCCEGVPYLDARVEGRRMIKSMLLCSGN